VHISVIWSLPVPMSGEHLDDGALSPFVTIGKAGRRLISDVRL